MGLGSGKGSAQARQQAQGVLLSIAENSEYAWCRNPENRGALQTRLDAVDSIIKGAPILAQFMVSEPRGAKSSMGDGEFTAALKKFCALKEPAEVLHKHTKSILQMHMKRVDA